ncbi:MAG: hypothetical protein U0931_19975 [Vulcanimicrobiota bacterium]
MSKCLLCILLLTLPCLAQDAWNLEVQLVRLNAGEKVDYLMEPAQWQQQLKHGQLLDQGSTVTSNKEVSLFLGRKYPITYFDPRAGMSQVNYVDVGYKAQFSFTPAADGRLQLDCSLEKKAFFDQKLPLPTVDVFQTYSTLLVRPGQVAIAACSRGGVGLTYFKELYPGHTFSEKDTFVWAVCARKLN